MTKFEGYPVEELDSDEDYGDDNGAIVDNVKTLSENVVGRKIIAVERNVSHKVKVYSWEESISGTALCLDDGTRVVLVDTDDCCAYTELKDVVLNLDQIEHVITGVGTTDGYTKWHIYANLGDVLELNVGWSCGNPFYYGYGFDIYVVSADGDIKDVTDEDSNEES